MSDVPSLDDLRQVADGKIQGDQAVEVLRAANAECKRLHELEAEYSQLTGAAEVRLIYGESGRGIHRSYR